MIQYLKLPQDLYDAAIKWANENHKKISAALVESIRVRLSQPLPETRLRTDRRRNPVYVIVISAMVAPELYSAVSMRAKKEGGKISALIAASMSDYLGVDLPPSRSDYKK